MKIAKVVLQSVLLALNIAILVLYILDLKESVDEPEYFEIIE